jgi:hypothetical protein
MREDGPERLIAATARLAGFRIGAETAYAVLNFFVVDRITPITNTFQLPL